MSYTWQTGALSFKLHEEEDARQEDRERREAWDQQVWDARNEPNDNPWNRKATQ